MAVWIARQAIRASRWALEKFKGKDEPRPSKEISTEGANPTGVGGLAGEAVATVVSTSRPTGVADTHGGAGNDQPRNFGTNPSYLDVAQGIQEAQEAAQRYREAHPLVDVPAIAGFDAEESKMIAEGRRIYWSPHFSAIREGHKKNEVVVGNIAGQVIQYEPALPGNSQGMSMGDDFVIGPSAFISDVEVARTIAQELYRLRMNQTGWSSSEHANDAHIVARTFADRAGDYIMRRLP